MTKKEYDRLYHQVYDKSPAGIWSGLLDKNRSTKREITKEDFIEWYDSQKKECIYCGIKEAELTKDTFQVRKKQHRLEIDRIENDEDYKKGNIVLACRHCNMLKGNIFTFDEMKIIGKMKRRKRGVVSNPS